MKKLFLITLCLFTLPLLTACYATAQGDDGYISVGDDRYESDRYYENRGKFCPPGQAKKGNC